MVVRPVVSPIVRPVVGSVTSPGVFGGGVADPTAWATFDGDSGYLNRVMTSGNPTAPWKIECWAETPTAGTVQTMISLSSNTLNTYYHFIYLSASNELSVTRRSGGTSSTQTYSVVDSGWHKYSYEYISDTAYNLYIDDVLTHEITGADSRSSAGSSVKAITIGAYRYVSPGNFYNGKLALAKFWSNAVLVGQWDLNGDATDSSGNSEDMAIVADVTFGP